MDYNIYVDLDEVLTNFKGAVEALGPEAAKGFGHESPANDQKVLHDAIEKAGVKFWADMPWSKDGKELWKLFKPYHPTLLSSPADFSSARAGKALWVRKNVPGTPLFLSNSKSEYVDPYKTSILIDDDKNNIGAWEARGGIGILHQSLESTERQFLDLVWNARS